MLTNWNEYKRYEGHQVNSKVVKWAVHTGWCKKWTPV